MSIIDEGVKLSVRAKRYREKAGAAERAFADFLYEHRNDEGVWGEAEVDPRTPEEQAEARAHFSVSVCVRFDPAITEAMSQRQKQTGETYSDLIRAAVADYLQPSANLSLPGTPVSVTRGVATGGIIREPFITLIGESSPFNGGD